MKEVRDGWLREELLKVNPELGWLDLGQGDRRNHRRDSVRIRERSIPRFWNVKCSD